MLINQDIRHLNKFHDFQISFAFYRILKHFACKFAVMFREQDVWNFGSVPRYALTLHSVTWLSFFESLNSSRSRTSAQPIAASTSSRYTSHKDSLCSPPVRYWFVIHFLSLPRPKPLWTPAASAAASRASRKRRPWPPHAPTSPTRAARSAGLRAGPRARHGVLRRPRQAERRWPLRTPKPERTCQLPPLFFSI